VAAVIGRLPGVDHRTSVGRREERLRGSLRDRDGLLVVAADRGVLRVIRQVFGLVQTVGQSLQVGRGRGGDRQGRQDGHQPQAETEGGGKGDEAGAHTRTVPPSSLGGYGGCRVGAPAAGGVPTAGR